MELAKEIIHEVISDRSAFGSSPQAGLEHKLRYLEAAVKEAEIFLTNGLSIAVHVLLGHEHCKSKQPANCKACCEVEVWTIQVSTLLNEFDGKMHIFPMFLKQAIRSQLHFSPIKSWFSGNKNTFEDNQQNVMKNYQCVYRISTSSYFQTEDENDTFNPKKIEEHQFPACKLDDKLLKITVKWRKKEFFPINSVKCPIKRVDGQLWISPNRNCLKFHNAVNVLARKSSKEIQINEIAKQSITSESHSNIIAEIPEYLGMSATKYIADKNNNLFEQQMLNKMENSVSLLTRNSIPQFTTACKNEKPSNKIGKLENLQAARINLMPPEKTYAVNPQIKAQRYARTPSPYSRSKKRASSRLLCNFEESILKGCLQPIRKVDGFKLQLAITVNSLSMRHLTIPVTISFFNENLSSLYMGSCVIPNVITNSKTKPGIPIPRRCILQAVLFNPQGSVVKIFLLNIDVDDMPPLSQSFIRQRTFSASLPSSSHNQNNMQETKVASPISCISALPNKNLATKPTNIINTGTIFTLNKQDKDGRMNYATNYATLKFLMHVRLISDHRNRIYLHGDIKMLLSNKCNDLEGFISTQTQSTTQMPQCPKYSPIK